MHAAAVVMRFCRGIQANGELGERVHLDRMAVVLYLAADQQPSTPTTGPGGLSWDRTKVAYKPSLKLGGVGGKPAVVSTPEG